MRYWRHYPKFLQIILLMLMIFTLSSFSTVIAYLSLKSLFGISLAELGTVNAERPDHIIAAAQFIQGLISLFTFLLSALLFAYLTTPRPTEYLGLRKPGKPVQVFIAIALLIAFMPLTNQIATWVQQLDLGEAAKISYKKNEATTEAMMRGTSIGALIIHLLLFALLPALGEEFLFRGALMRLSYSNSKNIHFAIFMSAGIFGLAHGSAYNFLSIMLMGILLGYIYYLSGSIWLSVLAHFINNTLAVLGLFLSNRQVVSHQAGQAENFPWYVLVVSFAAFLVLFSLLRKNATPLPPDWDDDFKGETRTIKNN